MDKWSKLEVDDALVKRGVDVNGLEYYNLCPRMSLENGLVRLFDNQSAIDMAKLGVYYGVMDVYAVQVGGVVIDDAEGREIPISQLTQEAARMDGVTASSSNEEEDEDQEGSEEDEGQEGSEGTDEPGEGSSEGYISDDDGLGQDSASEYEVEGELGVEGEGGSASEEFEEEVVATKKGKRKVVEVEQSKRRSKAKGKEKEKEKVDDDVPTFFDSDYDLRDKEEDEIMEAQVQGWKNVVASMRVIEDGDEVASSDNLPTDSPSEGDGMGDDDDPDMPQVISRRFKLPQTLMIQDGK